VFTDEAGEPFVTFRRAWISAVLKAHDIQPAWTQGDKRRKNGKLGWRKLDAESHARFRAIDLHWHDLRHEHASRLVERSVPLAQVRDLLGHASITTTERDDNQALEALKLAANRLEAGKTFDTLAAADARTKFQGSFKIGPEEPRRGRG